MGFISSLGVIASRATKMAQGKPFASSKWFCHPRHNIRNRTGDPLSPRAGFSADHRSLLLSANAWTLKAPRRWGGPDMVHPGLSLDSSHSFQDSSRPSHWWICETWEKPHSHQPGDLHLHEPWAGVNFHFLKRTHHSSTHVPRLCLWGRQTWDSQGWEDLF